MFSSFVEIPVNQQGTYHIILLFASYCYLLALHTHISPTLHSTHYVYEFHLISDHCMNHCWYKVKPPLMDTSKYRTPLNSGLFLGANCKHSTIQTLWIADKISETKIVWYLNFHCSTKYHVVPTYFISWAATTTEWFWEQKYASTKHYIGYKLYYNIIILYVFISTLSSEIYFATEYSKYYIVTPCGWSYFIIIYKHWPSIIYFKSLMTL